MDSIKSEVFKSLFRSSKDREHLIRTVQELQRSDDAGRANKEDEIQVIIDGFLGYNRAFEQKVQGEVEKACQERSKKANEEIKNSLDAVRKSFEEEREDFEKQKKRVEREILDSKTLIEDLQRQKKELQCQNKEELQCEKDKELQSQLDTYPDTIESYRKRMAELQMRNDTQHEIINDGRATIEQLQCQIAFYTKEIKSYKRRTAQLEVIAQANTETGWIKYQTKEINDLWWQLHNTTKELEKLKAINAPQKTMITDYQVIGKSTETLERVIHLDPKGGTLTIKVGRQGLIANIQHMLPNGTVNQPTQAQLPPLGAIAQKAGLVLLEAVAAMDHASECLDTEILDSMTHVEKAMLYTILNVLVREPVLAIVRRAGADGGVEIREIGDGNSA
ncbi:MAG: hypothetical protein LQ343_007735 [Gyalolechia ehrenbergii]|nr:MAG: hypothetical protein LQ343_007735 [Gyalolechia ehrenbergii]